jgi:glycosyltransferase involved in cell wall biosynthesis
MDNKTLTIFTPSFNRAYSIGRTYESLCRQTCKDFEWLVIDDGSTDNTQELIEGWIEENKISIRYIYQNNQGMHGAHNTAYKNINTELNTCIDSDDWMPDDAVEKIVSFWKKNGSNKVAGIIGLDATKEGKVIGTSFPEKMDRTTLMGFYRNGGSGDKKLVYRTSVVKKYPPYPLFEGEKYVGLSYLYMLIDQDYELLTLNYPLVIVEYQQDGSSINMFRQYWKNPQGFAFLRREYMPYAIGLKERMRVCIHYVSSSIILRDTRFLRKSPLKLMTVLAIIPGFILYLIIRYNVKKDIKYKVNDER